MATARRIHDLHRSVIETLSAELPAGTSRLIAEEFERRAYSYFSPDVFDIGFVFEALDSLVLGGQQREQIAALRDQWRGESMRQRRAMLDEYVSWKAVLWVHSGYPPDLHADYARKMKQLRDGRRAGALAAIEAITAILSPEQFGEIEDSITTWRAVLAEDDAVIALAEQRSRLWPPPNE